jgi:hypothetical protein
MADPTRTYAIVVGVDQYDLPGDAWALPHSKQAAVDFALWLRSAKVPAENICVVTNGQHRELPTELENSTLHYPKADIVRGLLANRLAERSGDLLLVFWSGHGELTGHEDRLLLSNTTNNLRATICVQDLRNALASRPLRNYSRKVLIVDACRSSGGPAGRPETFYVGEFSKPTASLIQSAAQGDKARVGVFAGGFLAALRAANWPPEFEAIARRLNAEVEAGESPHHSTQASALQSAPSLPAQPELFCDRKKATTAFLGSAQRAFQSSAPRPVLVIAYSEPHHRPDSLVDRLITEVHLMHVSQLSPKVVEWDHNDAGEVLRQLAGQLLNEWNHPPAAADFAQQLSRPRKGYILIRHNVSGWRDSTGTTLAAYLDFWRQWPAVEGAIPVFVLFAIVQDCRRELRHWFRRIPDRRIPRVVSEFSQEALIVNDVELVDRGHLADLFSKYRPRSMGSQRDALIRQVLGAKLTPRPMDHVERQLIPIFQSTPL